MKYALMISKYSKVSTWLIKANLMVGLVKISCCKICAAVESIKNFAKCWYLVCFLIGALIHFMKFLSLEITLYLYKSTIHPYMVYCCHIWAGAPSCYLELLDKVQKRICQTNGPSLVASLEPLAHRQNVASLSLF